VLTINGEFHEFPGDLETYGNIRKLCPLALFIDPKNRSGLDISHVLVVDELGYLTYGADAANVLFHVVNDRHLRKRPMIFTTNKPLSEWGKVLHDEDLAAAILDRILERGRFIHLDGPWWRTRHLNLEEVLPAAATCQNFRNPQVRQLSAKCRCFIFDSA
jgi:hypothetical protein